MYTRHPVGLSIQWSARVLLGAAAETCLPVLSTPADKQLCPWVLHSYSRQGRIQSSLQGQGHNFSLPVSVHFRMAQKCWPEGTLGSAPNRLQNSQVPASEACSPPSKPQGPAMAQEGLIWLSREDSTLTLPCRQCSRSLPEGSSVKRAKPEWDDFLMPVSWFSCWRNSSTVEEPSKPTTCRGRVLVPGGAS